MAIMIAAGARTAATAKGLVASIARPLAPSPQRAKGSRRRRPAAFVIYGRPLRIGGLQRLDQLHHLPPLIGIGQRSMHGAEIVYHMARIGGAGNDCGDA